MGLAVGVGVLADLLIHDSEGADWARRSIADLNAVLQRHGLPAHQEPESFPRPLLRHSCTSFPYSFLHYPHVGEGAA